MKYLRNQDDQRALRGEEERNEGEGWGRGSLLGKFQSRSSGFKLISKIINYK